MNESIGAQEPANGQPLNFTPQQIGAAVSKLVSATIGDDWIYNDSYKGLIYGDTVDGQGAGGMMSSGLRTGIVCAARCSGGQILRPCA